MHLKSNVICIICKRDGFPFSCSMSIAELETKGDRNYTFPARPNHCQLQQSQKRGVPTFFFPVSNALSSLGASNYTLVMHPKERTA